ncbi:RepA-linked protein [Bacillus phage 0105phi7-2]|uniref:RepA-linked protein n=1 Tax=Bacillus phage 0105phi7-2 TaxID=3025408 RepID=A0AAE9YG41_9CAUD|nr:RepA-linked protein [Bacillus phage 0105phi7-2]WCS66579.1 RepA-linked protein [Bacillus phage 0105phi7-2]
MSNRNIADLFGDSAVRNDEDKNETQQNKEVKLDETSNVNVNINDNVNEMLEEQKQNDNKTETKHTVNNVIENDDILGFLKEEQDKKVVGFHLDKDVRQAFQKVLGKKPQRGAQSELANRIFRDFFEKRGLL